MTDKEERIYICKTFKTDPCEICEGSGQIECVICRKKPMFNQSISRTEAVERMAKAICKISCACKYYSCGNCTEFLEHYTPDLAEAALNALFEDKK